MRTSRTLDTWWFLAWAIASSVWCLTAAAHIGPTFDEPLYLQRGLDGWRHFSHWGLLQLGTMPLPIDVQTLPLYLWELSSGMPIDTQNDIDDVLFWMRAGNMVFWWLLLFYGGQIGRMLAGPWGGRLAVAFLACEPNLLAHAALATTDIALTACLLALLYHFRRRRECGWFRRLGLPALWFGLAITAKASAVVYGPLCFAVIEMERLIRAGAFAGQSGSTVRQRLGNIWQQLQPARRDLPRIAAGGFVVALVYCGCDFRPQAAFIEWASKLPGGPFASCMLWLSENLCIFSNAAEGIVRQIKHNMRGHGTFILGQAHPRSLWYYFPVLLTIKLSIPLLLAPFAVAVTRARALTNWACVTAFALLVFSLTFRVQIGIRLVLPLVAIGTVGLAAAAVEAAQSARWLLSRRTLACGAAASLLWMIASAALIWPQGLCYVNECWGGPSRGYALVSDSNYDWGQGIPELLTWQRQHADTIDVWYFGRDGDHNKPPLRGLPLHTLPITSPDDILNHIQARYLAVSTTLLYGHATTLAAHRNAAAFLRGCEPVGRTTTFLIFERDNLVLASKSGQ